MQHQAEAKTSRLPAVSIGILTYKRPDSLGETLASLVQCGVFEPHGRTGATNKMWRLAEVLVIDNDSSPTAADAVSTFADAIDNAELVRHVHEPTPGLAAARNRALDEADGDLLVFIDDDEVADAGWPGGLVTTMVRTGAALVGAPVRTEFVEAPPKWVVDGGYFDRDEPPDGTVMPWLRSGNLAIDLAAVREAGVRFDPAFARSGGEDVAFSRLASSRGLELRWAAAEAVTERVGPDRTTVRWVTNRWRRGSSAYVRAHLASDDSRRRRVETVARGGARIAQGAATALLGVATLQWSRMIKGVAEIHRGIGYLEGLAGRSSTAYGGEVGTKPHHSDTTDGTGAR